MVSKIDLFKKSSDFEPFTKPTYILSNFIILLTYLFLHIVNIKGTLIILLYIGSLVPFLIETKQIITTPNNYSSAKNQNYDLKIADFLKLKYILLFVIILIYSLSPLYLPDILINQMNGYSTSQTFNQNVNELTEIILLNSTNDYEKTKALYDWSNINSKNIYGVYSKKAFIQIYPLHLYLTPPYYCIRLIEHQNPEWILSSRCGACEEFSQIFMILADNANLTVRSVHNHGYDHNWNEVFIDGKWIIVDPSMNRFDVPPSYYEDDLDWVSTYVFAIYPNGTKEDITSRYTNLSHLTLRVTDDKMNPVSNASVSVFSNNHPKHSEINTTFQTKTNSNGTCLIALGEGNYTLVVEKMIDEIPFSSRAELKISEDETTTYELTLKAEKFYWINNNEALSLRTVSFIGSVLYSFLLWIVLIMYIELKRIENKNGKRIQL